MTSEIVKIETRRQTMWQ